MPVREYVRVARPWHATFDAHASQPAAFYTSVIRQALRYGMPSRRRFGPALAAVARHELFPGAVTARILRIRRRSSRRDLDDQLTEVTESWADLRERSRGLPETPGHLSILELQRSAGVTRFVFGSDPHPLLVLKIPAEGDERVDVEARALEEASPAEVAPLFLGRLGDARVQEGIAGSPLRVEPVAPENAGDLLWKPDHRALAAALTALATHTRKEETPKEINFGAFDAVAKDRLLSEVVRNRVAAAVKDLTRLRCAVLRHVDTSAQNCLVGPDGSFAAFVDWETARTSGVPGWDMLNAAIAYTEQGVGLVRWSDERAFDTFAGAWERSPFWREARAATDSTARAAGVPDDLLAAIEVSFHARRLGRLLIDPTAFATSPGAARRMLEVVCER